MGGIICQLGICTGTLCLMYKFEKTDVVPVCLLDTEEGEARRLAASSVEAVPQTEAGKRV